MPCTSKYILPNLRQAHITKCMAMWPGFLSTSRIIAGTGHRSTSVTPSFCNRRWACSMRKAIAPRGASFRDRYISKAQALPCRQGLQQRYASTRPVVPSTATNSRLRAKSPSKGRPSQPRSCSLNVLPARCIRSMNFNSSRSSSQAVVDIWHGRISLNVSPCRLQ